MGPKTPKIRGTFMKERTLTRETRTKTALASILFTAFWAYSHQAHATEWAVAPKIIGGDTVSGSDPIAKSTAALLSGGALCTVSLLSVDLALTAAHCVEGAAAGTTKLVFDRSIAGKPITRAVTGVIQYSTYGSVTGEHPDTGDMALVRFSGGLPTGYTAASFWTSNSALSTGQWVTLAGYGITDGEEHTGSGTLRKTWVKVAQAKYGKTEIIFDQRFGQGACHGDSGGPAILASGGKNYVLGVTSRGYNDAKDDCSQYAVYTRVAPYKKWIKAAAKALGSTATLAL